MFRTKTRKFAKEAKRIVVILIKPTSYDDEGYPYRYRRGVLPSNSLATMYALTKQALTEAEHSEMLTEVYALEDGVKTSAHYRQLQELERRFRVPEPGTKLIVGLVAVQTAQFPRACDLIDEWQKRGATCIIGGFHVSGSISTMLDGIHDTTRKDVPCPKIMPKEVQSLMEKGVIVFHGEAENQWNKCLQEVLLGKAQQLYRGGMPALNAAPLPEYPQRYFAGSFASPMETFDTGRGCPFACSFCTIINVQGRDPRYRNPQAIIAAVQRTCEEEKRRNKRRKNNPNYKGSAAFFFTDDNFARNPLWEQVLDGLIALREEGYEISFMIEADLACGKIRNFIPKLARAGCSQMFMGVESMNQQNLNEASKRQNKVEQYEQLWAKCHEYGLMVHAGYIVGFPHDTPESVARDVQSLFEAGADQSSFFVLTPLPGSEDHIRALMAGVPMDVDFNRYDSFRVVWDHPTMSRDEWYKAYQGAWQAFYTPKNMIVALKRCKTRQSRLNLMRNYLWYRWAFGTEQAHPMVAGLGRTRDYRDRRPGAAPISLRRHLITESARYFRYIGRFFLEFYVFQHVVFETEVAPFFAEQHSEVSGKVRNLQEWALRTFKEGAGRAWLNQFWIEYGRKRWKLLSPTHIVWHLKMLFHACTEVVYSIRFAWMLTRLAREANT